MTGQFAPRGLRKKWGINQTVFVSFSGVGSFAVSPCLGGSFTLLCLKQNSVADLIVPRPMLDFSSLETLSNMLIF